ncbi:hypothetical protein G6L37_17590 [Agrobacterium rubi]|uniref:hypothetical protein n=1 Tax=Agrobacterium rubi TaxID=28099 RepID=UPI00157245F5|nr:hypothetical protein [Agrobacterium rubi]NTF07967.1 hypothetical protein [Agrobacterium rubi]NTF20211.1 hypothetical protein [Agrobacterium rubi]NTF27182.1 hypothetical protein [Agrobacterium rubi]
MRNLPNFAKALHYEREHLIRRALSEACHWSRFSHAGAVQSSDQYWLECFSKSPVATADVRRFLATYKVVRAKWLDQGVADEISALRRKGWQPVEGVLSLSENLARHIEREENGVSASTGGGGELDAALDISDLKDDERGQRTSAASKIAMFTMHEHPVFIWDSLALQAMKLRQWKFDEASGVSIRQSRFSQSFMKGGRHDYKTYHAASSREYASALADDLFRDAVATFVSYVSATGGPMYSIVNKDFYGRRLFDKLMVCEGERIGEWWAETKPPGRRKATV